MNEVISIRPPITREEIFLTAVIEGLTPPDAITRIEQYLAKIAGAAITVPAPVTRVEMYLAKIAGLSVILPLPITRIEFYLAKIAGENVEVPDPIARLEYYLNEWANAQQGEETTVTGNAPITLIDAIASELRSLIQYGAIGQASTPTPSAPQDIKCNNGALRAVHRSGLPSGYKLLEYIGGSGSQYVITDLYLASTDVVECEYRNSSTTGYGAIYGIYKTGESSALYGNQTYYGYDVGNNKVDTEMAVDTEWHSARHDFVNGTLTIDNTTVSFTPFEFVNSTKNAVLSRYYNGNYGYNWKGYIRKFKVTRGNEVICNLLPAKNSSNVAGLYDLVSGNFYTATGGTLLEGNEVDDYELRVVGTPEVLSVTASGAETQTASVPDLFAVGNYADEVEIIGGTVTHKVKVLVLDGTENWFTSDSFLSGMYNLIITDLYAEKTNVTTNRKTPFCTHFERSTNWVAAGNRLGKIQAMKNAAETQSVIGIGYETATAAGVNDFKAWLADQYAAGTPVIVLYPLAEETTESVTAQPLATSAGTNVISVAAEVSPIELDAVYLKEVEE